MVYYSQNYKTIAVEETVVEDAWKCKLFEFETDFKYNVTIVQNQEKDK